MRITSRTKAIAFFITLGVCLVALAIFLNITWIVFHWRQVVPLVLGIIFFGVIIAGLGVNTIFIVREIRRNERQDSFLNAVTHELKTPITSIRLYLETLQSRPLDEAKRRDFYRIMLEDSDRLLGMVEQVLKAGEARHADRRNWQEGDFAGGARHAGTRPSASQSKARSASFWRGSAGGPGSYGQSRRVAHSSLQPSR